MTEDLWASLEEASKKPVATVMNTWTKQMGYPVLTVEGKQVIKGASPKLIGFIIQYIIYRITRIFCG